MFCRKGQPIHFRQSFYMLENAKKPALLFFSRALRGYVLVLTHWPGPDTTDLPRLIIGLLLFVRHLVQACALPIGFRSRTPSSILPSSRMERQHAAGHEGIKREWSFACARFAVGCRS